MTIDAGIYIPASIGDRIWLDTNADGIQDVGESNITESITVELHYDGNNSIAQSKIVTNGSYLFTDIVPDEYYVTFSLPSGYRVSEQNVTANGTDDTNDSDVNASTMRTAATTLISDENDTTWDMGIYKPASIGDRIWLDTNADGVQNAGESNFIDANVTVTLHDVTTGTTVGSITTDTGSYEFAGLIPDEYYVKFTLTSRVYTLTK